MGSTHSDLSLAAATIPKGFALPAREPSGPAVGNR
jgi:hypothetical protein